MFGPFSASFSHKFFINFLSQFNIILSSSVLLSGCHINTVDDFLNYATFLFPELEQLALPESTEGGSPLLVCTLNNQLCFLLKTVGKAVRICHTPDGGTSPNYKLLHFVTTMIYFTKSRMH
jgi:hypothetical protein